MRTMGEFEPTIEKPYSLGDLIDFLKENRLAYVPTYSGNIRLPEGFDDVPVVVVQGSQEMEIEYIGITDDESTVYIKLKGK